MGKPLSEMSLEELWELFPIRLSGHRPEWAQWYEEEKRRLVSVLGESAARIDHIGSTYVEGLEAKPIVDILLQAAANADIAEIKEMLLAGGWLLMAEKSDYGELDLNKGYTPDGFADRVFHLHVRREGDWDELYFRDFLVSHPEAAAEYARLKRQLLEKYEHNRDAYTGAKTEFVRACVAKARAGAAHPFAGLYRSGRISCERDSLDLLGLPESSIGFLTEFGLPVPGECDNFLGFVFEKEFHTYKDGKVWIGKIQYVHDEFSILIDPSNGHVLEDAGGKIWFMNSDISKLIPFLSRIYSFFERQKSLEPDAKRNMLTDGERYKLMPPEKFIACAREKRRALIASGEIVPLSEEEIRNRASARKKELQEIEKFYSECDPSATGEGTWWRRILDLAEDEQI